MATESGDMEAVGTSSRRAQTYALLSFAALVLAGCDVVTGCCRESFTVSHGLIYGVVRFSDGRDAVGASVHSTVVGTDTVTTKSGGAYRLPLAFPLLGPGSEQTGVNVFPPNYRPGVDSVTRVAFTVQRFANEPAADSTRVDITLIAVP